MPSFHKVKFKSASAALEFTFGATPEAEVGFLLQENGDFLLKEDGDRLELDVPAIDEGFQNDQRRFAFASSSGTTLIENKPGTG